MEGQTRISVVVWWLGNFRLSAYPTLPAVQVQIPHWNLGPWKYFVTPRKSLRPWALYIGYQKVSWMLLLLICWEIILMSKTAWWKMPQTKLGEQREIRSWLQLNLICESYLGERSRYTFQGHGPPVYMDILLWISTMNDIPFSLYNMYMLYGCFLKWWYPQNTPKWSFLVGKPMVVGYHHVRKPLYIHLQLHVYIFVCAFTCW